jgi:hypothetical protein
MFGNLNWFEEAFRPLRRLEKLAGEAHEAGESAQGSQKLCRHHGDLYCFGQHLVNRRLFRGQLIGSLTDSFRKFPLSRIFVSHSTLDSKHAIAHRGLCKNANTVDITSDTS